MENHVLELEKQQSETAKKSGDKYSKLEGAYEESENLISLIKQKQRELFDARKKLWITVVIVAVIISGLIALRIYL